MTWAKARCPECGNVYDQWHGLPTGGSRGIIFDEDGSVDLGDLLVTDATLMCPNPKCHFMLDDVTNSELEKWFKKYKVEGDD